MQIKAPTLSFRGFHRAIPQVSEPPSQKQPGPLDAFQSSEAPSSQRLQQSAPAPAPPGEVDLEQLLQEVLADPAKEQQLISTIQYLNATKQLEPALAIVASKAVETGTIPPMPEEKLQEMVGRAAGMIDAQFRERGMTPDTAGAEYVDWDTLSQRHLTAVRSTQAPPRLAGSVSLLTDKTFLSELETLQGAPFRDGNSVQVLTDGPASFAVRDRLIEEAKESVHLMTWAIYDDETGWDTVRKLVEKKAEGVDVKVIVDGQISELKDHDAPTRFLQENGVEVVRWRDSDRPYDGNHRKMLVVDGREAVIGGINIGDVYSHRAGEVKWRDTDVHLTGPAVDDGARLFRRLWNEKASSLGLSELSPSDQVSSPSGGVKSAVVDHVPGPQGDAHILLATMKAIEGATESVDIENAYFINTPGMKDVLLKALADGVRVRILTNSSESIDEPLIAGPILSSLPDLVAAGAEVYLKKGDTLHSKFMTVDGVFSSVGSHNHHPRSQRFEGEMVLNSLDANLAQSLTATFETDIAQAQKIDSPEQIVVPESPLNLLAMRYFFDAL